MAARVMTSLPASYQRMKQEYYTDAQKKGFKGYRSPWVPVTVDNRDLIKTGDLIIDARYGVEGPYRIGRTIKRIDNGRLIGTKALDQFEPWFVWVDLRNKENEKYLTDNFYRDTHKEYSAIVERALRHSHKAGLQLIQDVAFPIYHETDRVSASNILVNGLDYIAISGRTAIELGKGFFCAGQTVEEVKGKGNLKGAIVKFVAAEGARPQWVSPGMSIGAAYTILSVKAYCSSSLNDYSMKIFASELAVYAYSSGPGFVAIFDSFDQYKPVEIITRF